MSVAGSRVMTMRVVSIVALLCVCGTGTAHAQDNPRIGIVMGYPANVGVLWHVTDRVGVRPEINFFRTTISTQGSGVLLPLSEELTSRSVTVAVSGLLYLNPKAQLRAYVSPRFGFTNVHVSDEPVGTSRPDNNSYLVSGSFGAQYTLGSHAGIFGEVGIEYRRSELERTVAPGTTTLSRTTALANRSGVGIALYF